MHSGCAVQSPRLWVSVKDVFYFINISSDPGAELMRRHPPHPLILMFTEHGRVN